MHYIDILFRGFGVLGFWGFGGLTDHVDRRLERGSLGPDDRRRLEALKTLDLAIFLHDMERGQPDAVVVEEGWAARHFNDPPSSGFPCRLSPNREHQATGQSTAAATGSPSTFARRRRLAAQARRATASCLRSASPPARTARQISRAPRGPGTTRLSVASPISLFSTHDRRRSAASTYPPD